jgi:hypothetical protein
MTHLPFIAAAYGLTLALAVWLGASAMLRLSRAKRRLEAYEAQAGIRRRDLGRP